MQNEIVTNTSTLSSLVSVIMAVYNAEDTIAEAIESVINQTYEHIELIIIDGQSTDRSVAIIKRYSSERIFFISEPDKGVYDAWNKGIRLSKGQWICFLGADDELRVDAVNAYVDFINQNQPSTFDYISSQVALTNSQGQILEIVGTAWDWTKYRRYMNVAHVGSFHARAIFDQVGFYDLTYQVIADYELLLRFGSSLRAGYIQRITADMKVAGLSDGTAALKELRRLRIEKLEYNKLYATILYLTALGTRSVRKFINKFGLFIRLKK